MTDAIVESGMMFFSENTYHIEKSSAYSLLGEHIKSVEFVRIMRSKLIFLEAKTTFPNPSKTDTSRFDEEIHTICDKFIHSVNLYASIKSGITIEALPQVFHDIPKVSLLLTLVIRNHEYEWCKHIKKRIEEVLPRYFMKIWKPQIMVINEEIAQKYNLIKSEQFSIQKETNHDLS